MTRPRPADGAGHRVGLEISGIDLSDLLAATGTKTRRAASLFYRLQADGRLRAWVVDSQFSVGRRLDGVITQHGDGVLVSGRMRLTAVGRFGLAVTLLSVPALVAAAVALAALHVWFAVAICAAGAVGIAAALARSQPWRQGRTDRNGWLLSRLQDELRAQGFRPRPLD